jgi:uncharacterized protein (DUF342 family)
MVEIGDGLEWKVSDDCLTVYCRAKEKAEMTETCEGLLAKIQKAGVKVSIDKSKILEIIQNKMTDWVSIGVGAPPVPPVPARLEYYVDASHLDRTAATDEHDRVDYKKLNLVLNVSKGQELVRKFDAIPGKAGQDVYGKTILPVEPPTVTIPVGDGVEIVDNGHLAIATSDGAITTRNQRISIIHQMPINSDVCYKTGNIEFNGTVAISKNVLAGFEVKAEGDVTIEGMVEAGRVEALGSITVRGGFQGGSKGVIKAGETIKLKFAYEGTLEAGRDILVQNNLMNCEVRAVERILMQGTDTIIAGGIYKAGEWIETDIAGSEIGVKTHLQIGMEENYPQVIAESEEELVATQKKNDDLDSALKRIQAVKEAGGVLNSEQEIARVQAVRAQFLLKGKIDHLTHQLQIYREGFERMKSGKVLIKGTAFPGVIIRFGSATYVVPHPIHQICLHYERGDIHVEAL